MDKKEPEEKPYKVKKQPKYDRTDSDGVLWRMKGSRPTSNIADSVMKDVLSEEEWEKWITNKSD